MKTTAQARQAIPVNANFGGTRVPVQNLFDSLEAGEGIDDFVEDFPDVHRDEAVSAVTSARVALADGAGRLAALRELGRELPRQVVTALPVRGCAFNSVKHMGSGQFYLFSTRDKNGEPLDGSHSYRLTVPPKVPVKQYWSATAYDRQTHDLIPGVGWASRSSLSENLQVNEDGSTDIWFGPTPPNGKISNWVPTKPGGKFEVLFRLYGPERPVFDKTWKLPDIEQEAD